MQLRGLVTGGADGKATRSRGEVGRIDPEVIERREMVIAPLILRTGG
jgi:hypothetical protein